MRKAEEFTFLSADQTTKIHVRGFLPEGRVVGWVQIAHGVAEHKERYDAFMQFLAAQGIAAFANDHLGHGQSICGEENRGFFAETDGWNRVVRDMKSLHDRLDQRFPGLPRILFGHSMGSFLSRTYIIQYPEDFSAAIFCGTGQQSPLLVTLGGGIAGLTAKCRGLKYHSRRLQNIVFGGYNKRIPSPRTPYDWLSCNEANVDAYLADPLCGGISSVGLFRDMLRGIRFLSDKANIQKIRKDLPLLLVAGEEDPVGDYGKGPRLACDLYRSAGIREVSLKLYKNARHELLREKNQEEVFQDLLTWMKAHTQDFTLRSGPAK